MHAVDRSLGSKLPYRSLSCSMQSVRDTPTHPSVTHHKSFRGFRVYLCFYRYGNTLLESLWEPFVIILRIVANGNLSLAVALQVRARACARFDGSALLQCDSRGPRSH